jgi:hypothetical protein
MLLAILRASSLLSSLAADRGAAMMFYTLRKHP